MAVKFLQNTHGHKISKDFTFRNYDVITIGGSAVWWMFYDVKAGVM